MKSIKNLLVPAIILIVLIISAIVYYAVDKFNSPEPDESSGGMIDVVFFNTADISSVSVFSRDSGRTASVLCSAGSGNDILYSYQGDDYNPSDSYSQSKLSAFISQMSSYYAYKRVSSSGNFAEYGLENPAYTISINGVNGSVTCVKLGNISPDGNYCYISVEGSTDIYAVTPEKLVVANVSAIDFLDSRVLNISYNDLSTVHFDRKTDGLSLDANIIYSGSGIPAFDFYSPFNHPASQYFGKIIDSLVKLEISQYVDVSSDELARYGLDNPDFHFVLTMNNGDKTEIFMSRNIGGFYYGYVSGIDNYFMINEFQIEGLELNESILIDPYICYCYVKNISSITGKYGDKSFIFELDVPEGKSITSSNVYVTLDGRNAQISDSYGRYYCSILFESIACIEIGGIETDAKVNTSSDPELSLEFLDKNYVTTTYEFYKRDDDSYYIFKNGEYTCFYVYSREIFNDGGTDTYRYGYWRAYELLNEAISGNMNGIYDLPRDE